MYDTNLSIGTTILGLLLALAVAKVFEFFCFAIDYSRIENVQFEDDEYYYYVKAIPKMTVAAPEKRVKRINVQTNEGRQNKVVEDKGGNTERHVTVERMGGPQKDKKSKGTTSGGKSVTIGKRDLSDIEAFFDELDDEN